MSDIRGCLCRGGELFFLGGGEGPHTKVKYILSILQIYWKYTSKVYLKHTPLIIQPDQLQKKKYTSSLCYFNKSTFEAHFVKLNQHFNVNLKYTSSIL